MPIRVPHHSIALHRNGQTVRPTIGKPFDFTAEEITEITAANRDALRRPVVETMPAPAPRPTTGETVDTSAPPTAIKRVAKPAAARVAASAEEDDDTL